MKQTKLWIWLGFFIVLVLLMNWIFSSRKEKVQNRNSSLKVLSEPLLASPEAPKSASSETPKAGFAELFKTSVVDSDFPSDHFVNTPATKKTDSIGVEPCVTPSGQTVPNFVHYNFHEPFECLWTKRGFLNKDCRTHTDFSQMKTPEMFKTWKSTCQVQLLADDSSFSWKYWGSKRWMDQLILLLQQNPTYFDPQPGGMAIWHGCNLKGRNMVKRAGDISNAAQLNISKNALEIFSYLAWIRVFDSTHQSHCVEIAVFCDVPTFVVPYLKTLDPDFKIHNLVGVEDKQQRQGGNVLSITEENLDRAFWKLVWGIKLAIQKKPMHTMTPPDFAFSPLFKIRPLAPTEFSTTIKKNDDLYTANMASLKDFEISKVLSENIFYELFQLVSKAPCSQVRQRYFHNPNHCISIPEPIQFSK